MEQIALDPLTIGESTLVGGTGVLLLNHHELEGSTSEVWLDLVIPDEDIDRHAIVGNTSACLVSPAALALDRLRPRLGEGSWVSH